MCNDEDEYPINYIAQAVLNAINSYRSKLQLKNLTLASVAPTQIAQNYACKLIQTASDVTGVSVKNSALGSSESLGIDGCPFSANDIYCYTWSQNSRSF
jgi:hypothetical protein